MKFTGFLCRYRITDVDSPLSHLVSWQKYLPLLTCASSHHRVVPSQYTACSYLGKILKRWIVMFFMLFGFIQMSQHLFIQQFHCSGRAVDPPRMTWGETCSWRRTWCRTRWHHWHWSEIQPRSSRCCLTWSPQHWGLSQSRSWGQWWQQACQHH